MIGERLRQIGAARPAIGVLAALFAVAAGVLIARFPPLALLAALGVVGCVVLVLWHTMPRLFLALLPVALAGYAFLGKGFAYIGVAPVYVGEMLLALAVPATIVSLRRDRITRLHLLLVAFMTLGVLRTLPYVPRYGLDALRDAVLWGYGLFAVAISLSAGDETLRRLVDRYRRVLPWFALWVPVAGLATFLFGSSLPRTPSSDAPLIGFKGGDMGVHLAGAAAFLLLGLFAARRSSLRAVGEMLLWPIWLLAMVVAGAVNRGGFLAAAVGVIVAMLLRPSRRGARFVWVALVLICVVALVNPSISTSRGRELSLNQISHNVLSIAGLSSEGDLDATKEWRLRWWTAIVDYTVRGPYFLTGKGFGVNLADADGFQVMADHSLRSPHNGHLAILARMGVPGFVLWIVLQVAFGVALLRAFFRARGRGDAFWAGVDAWLLTYWLSMLVNASFDVYLEGPQGGIWFWSVVGFGLVALRVQRDESGSTAANALPPRAGEPARAAPWA